jgi:hypothetical protein
MTHRWIAAAVVSVRLLAIWFVKVADRSFELTARYIVEVYIVNRERSVTTFVDGRSVQDHFS